MRYKEQSLNKIEQVNNRIKNVEFLVLRGQQNEAIQALEELKEKVEELRSLISIEHNEFETYGN
jgi:archaellum component FlaC